MKFSVDGRKDAQGRLGPSCGSFSRCFFLGDTSISSTVSKFGDLYLARRRQKVQGLQGDEIEVSSGSRKGIKAKNMQHEITVSWKRE